MFKLNKLKTFFLKESFISFYKDNETFYIQKKTIKNSDIIEKEYLELNEEEFIKFIEHSFAENTQTYISTIIDSFNQGVVDSCSHQKYKELEINIDNIKILCLNNYSIFIGLYELNQFQKEMEKFKIDFIFSPYLIIDLYKEQKENLLYMLLTNNFILITIYNNTIPIYSNIHQFKIDEIMQNNSSIENENIIENDTIDDDIGIIDDIESLDDIDDIEEIDNIEEIEENETDETFQEEIQNNKIELEIIEFLKISIKDYYENYNSDFLETIYILHNNQLEKNFLTILENELLIKIKTKKINILEDINKLAIKEVINV